MGQKGGCHITEGKTRKTGNTDDILARDFSYQSQISIPILVPMKGHVINKKMKGMPQEEWGEIISVTNPSLLYLRQQ